MFKRTRMFNAVLVTLGGALLFGAGAVSAQGNQRVEITGSSIKRVDAESSLPVTVLKVEDLARTGVTTVEQALQRLSSNQSNFGVSQSIGATTGGKAEADLRGLSGPTGSNANKTLVLLNGRRLANHSFDAAAVDLNAIPLAAVDRIEVLRDGASALYGTDAIGGVINFILRRDFQGVDVSASLTQADGSAGSTKRASIVTGFGSLSQQGFNLMAVLDWRKQNVLAAVDRGFGSTGILGTTRNDITAGTSGTAYPGDVGGFEPSAPNCDPPFSVPRNTTPSNGGAFNSCRYDFTKSIDLIPANEQLTGLLRGSMALGKDNTVSAEYMRANNKATSRVAPAPTSHLIPATSPFFPAGAPRTSIPNIRTADPNDTVLGGVVNWRQVPAGKRTSGDDTTTERAMIELEGSRGGMDYRAAFGTSKNKSTASVKEGYVNDSLIQDGVWSGAINPFGTHTAANFGQTAAGVAAIAAAQVVAPTLIGSSKVDFFDARVSMDLFKMAGGSAAAAFGLEHRKEKSTYEATDITAELSSLGVDPDSDTSGSRKVSALFAELNLPVAKGLDVTLAGRFDKYNDFGSTFNPKIGVRYQPTKQLLLRGSANKGFRAPTLYEIFQPQSLSFTSDNYDDPVLCPNGNPVAGASAGVVCGQQVLQRSVGPVGGGKPSSALAPEKSNSFSAGIVFEPMNNLSVSLDYFQLKIKNLIGGLPEQEIFASASKYQSRFIRCSQIPASGSGLTRASIDTCLNFPAFDPIAYIDVPTENLGELHTNGIDIGVNWRSAASSMGVFAVSLEGTYLTKYKYQRENGGAFINAVGRYSDNAPVFRWQHVLSLNWSKGPWSATLGQRFKSAYEDQGGGSEVGEYMIHDASVTWTGIKNLTLTAGIGNLFDKDPPLSVQATTFQRGYDPRFTDPMGRTYQLRAGYKF